MFQQPHIWLLVALGFSNHKPGSLLRLHTGQSDDLSDIMSQLEHELRLSSSTGLTTDAKIEKVVKRTVRVAHNIPNLRSQLVNFLGIMQHQ
jgi:hypothetical protein